MKANIHPSYYSEANVICVCGNKFTVGSTTETINIELCDKCHPFYTGEQKFVDTASRIQKFENKQNTAKKYADIKVAKKQEKEKKNETPKTLREMLQAFK